MQTWVDRFPGRLERELEEFWERDLTFELDRAQLAEQGRVVLRGQLQRQDEQIELEVIYPDLFPYLRPEVRAPGLQLDRHQNPYEHNLCLLDRSTRAWNPSDTAAWLIAERVPHLLSLIETGGEVLRDGEAPQGEPASTYFPAALGTAVFVPTAALQLDAEAEAGSGRIYCSVAEPPRLQLRGLVGELAVKTRKRKSRVVATADPELAARFGGHHLTFRWVRLKGPPAGNTASDVLAAADAVRQGFGSPPWQTAADGELAICGVVFEEEVAQGCFEDAWMFAVRARPVGVVQERSYLVRGERLTRQDLGARIPALSSLPEKRVAVIGAGALGAGVALELARAQLGELRVLDDDIVEAGTIVRWPSGLTAVGHSKVHVIAERIRLDYPFTSVVPFVHRLGQSADVRTGRSETELDVLDRLLEGADLVIDATAEIGVQQLIAAAADAEGIPQLYLSATEGARGGIVAPLIPPRPGCWLCLQWHLDTRSFPLPPRDETGTVQPRGCASPTFTGTGFDLLPIIAQGARVATDILRGGAPRQVQICSIPDNGSGPPNWESRVFDVHPKCPECSAAAAA